MARGQYQAGKGPAVDSPNSASWRERALELEQQLKQEVAEKEELGARLEEIASIAAPDWNAQIEGIDAKLANLCQEQAELRGLIQSVLSYEISRPDPEV
jgi:predicted nuclease with TOPRIM domain